MLSGVRMKFIIVVILFLYILEGTTAGKSKSRRKSLEGKKALEKNSTLTTTAPPPAIIAIEIVDPNENKTTSKNSKRTIESSLGYGYQNYFGASHQPPKFQVYKYSQHDIPAFQGAVNFFTNGIRSQNYDIQKSVSYKLPSSQISPKYTNVVHQGTNQYYTPGTTLYSTLNNQGQIGGLSSNIPYQQSHAGGHIPVIILRVFPNQLADPSGALFPKLPQSNPYAQSLNQINIQSLLSNYVQNMVKQMHHIQPVQQPIYHSNYQQTYEQPQYQQDDYQQQQNYQYNHEPQYQHIQLQEHPAPSSSGSSSSSNDLLTHENYPADTHTRVIFRNHKGHLKTTTTIAPSIPEPETETKVIKIHVPQGYSGVEVQTPESQYSYVNNDDGQGVEKQQQMYYYETNPMEQQHQQLYYYPAQEQAYQMYTPQQHQQQEVEQKVEYEQAPPSPVQYNPQEFTQQQVSHQQQEEAPENIKAPFNYHAHQKRKSRSKKIGNKVPLVLLSDLENSFAQPEKEKSQH